MLDVPDGMFATAYRLVTSHVRDHPKFANRRLVQSWYHWIGKNGYRPDLAGTPLPAVETQIQGGDPVRFVASENTPGGPRQSTSRISINITWELWTPGPDVLDNVNVGELIFDAFHPLDRTEARRIQERFAAAGIVDFRWVRPIMPPADKAYGSVAVYGCGTLEITLEVRT